MKLAKDIMTKKPVTISPEATIRNAITKMEKYNVKEIPIISKGKLTGMVTFYDILDYVKAGPNTNVSDIAIMPPTLEEDTPINEIAKKMLETGVEALPVIKKGKVIGIVSDFDVVNSILDDPKVKKLKVKDTMRPVEQIVKNYDTIASARRLMRFHGVERIPVIDDEGRSMGLIISIDILDKFMSAPKQRVGKKAVVGRRNNPLAMPVSGVMRKNIPAITVMTTVNDASALINKAKLKAAQVVDKQGKVIGMFYRWDLLNKIVPKGFGEGVWLNFSGLPLKVETVEVLKNYLTSDIKRLKRLAPETKSIDVHVKKLHGATEDKWNYEVNVALTKASGKKEIVSKGRRGQYGYNLMFTLADALQKIEKQLQKKYGRRGGKQYSKK